MAFVREGEVARVWLVAIRDVARNARKSTVRALFKGYPRFPTRELLNIDLSWIQILISRKRR